MKEVAVSVYICTSCRAQVNKEATTKKDDNKGTAYVGLGKWHCRKCGNNKVRRG